MIREIVSRDELETSVTVIRNSFKPVAVEFGLNGQNCPSHPALITLRQLQELQSRGTRFFGYFADDVQVGFVGAERANETTYYLEKLAVLPEHRHRGYGKELVEYVFKFASENKAGIVSIGIINKHEILKNWYRSLGFCETGNREFEHLPFTVCFMDKPVA